MNISNAFAALERIINAAAQDQYSESIVQNARAGLNTLRNALQNAERDRDQWKRSAESYLDGWNDAVVCDYEPMRDDRDSWQRRANAQLEITRAAVAIVAAPFQIYDTRGHTGYRISTQEFDDLQRAVEAYKTLSEQETARSMQSE
jgi:hypothetical protein